jgi:hypothetical protein
VAVAGVDAEAAQGQVFGLAGVGNRPMTFIVRVFVDEGGGAISGVVEQVRTGRKEPIYAIEDISPCHHGDGRGRTGGRGAVKRTIAMPL